MLPVGNIVGALNHQL